MNGHLPTELQIFVLSVLLCFAQIFLQAVTGTAEKGVLYNMSARDNGTPMSGLYAQRMERALKNFLETYPVFVGLALALVITGRADGAGVSGAWLWLFARIVFVPLYGFGVMALRSLAWFASIVGLGMMLMRLAA